MAVKKMDLSGLAVTRKGEARPVTEGSQMELEREAPPEAQAAVAAQPAAIPTPRRTPPPAAPEADEPRTNVTVRLTLGIQERMRLANFHLKMSKQDIVETAVSEYLAKRHY